MRSISLFVVALALLITCPGLARAQSAADQRASAPASSLQGVDGVFLTVDAVDAELETDGLYRSAITATAERTLEAAGIAVLTRDEVLQDPRRPLLRIVVDSQLTGAGLHAYHLKVEFRQTVGLLHDPNLQLSGVTWTAPSRTGAVARDQVAWLNDDLQAMLDAFVAAHQVANAE